jgi:hypothetical protein
MWFNIRVHAWLFGRWHFFQSAASLNLTKAFDFWQGGIAWPTKTYFALIPRATLDFTCVAPLTCSSATNLEETEKR